MERHHIFGCHFDLRFESFQAKIQGRWSEGRAKGGNADARTTPYPCFFLLHHWRFDDSKFFDGKLFLLGRKLRKIRHQNVSLSIFSLSSSKGGVYGSIYDGIAESMPPLIPTSATRPYIMKLTSLWSQQNSQKLS